MSKPNTIPSAAAIQLLLRPPSSIKCLDVRSEGEFLDGSIPGSANFPILNNRERHEVGLAFKQKGPEIAVSLGHQLVGPHREARIQSWIDHLKGAEWPLVACWRGGQRSEIATEWIESAGGRALRVKGGYKALRSELLASLHSLPEFLVISGPTGSHKTKLLRAANWHLDLELLAKHRGSAFGQHLHEPQPSQASFENALGLALLRRSPGTLLVEDESMLIGRIHLPLALRNQMNESPVVRIHMDADERVRNILAEYITEPLQNGFAPGALHAQYQGSIQRIEKKLGGLLARQILEQMAKAFLEASEELHGAWIRDLLLHYYDNAYAYSFARANRKIAFEGDWNECQHWIQKKFA